MENLEISGKFVFLAWLWNFVMHIFLVIVFSKISNLLVQYWFGESKTQSESLNWFRFFNQINGKTGSVWFGVIN